MDDDNNKIVWRVLSWRYMAGLSNIGFRRQYMFDDLVVSDRLPRYIQQMEDRGIENIKMEKKGTLKFVMDNNLNPEPRPGASRLSNLRKNRSLDDYA